MKPYLSTSLAANGEGRLGHPFAPDRERFSPLIDTSRTEA